MLYFRIAIALIFFFGFLFYFLNHSSNNLYKKLNLDLRLIKHIALKDIEILRINNDGLNNSWLVPRFHHVYLFNGYFIVADVTTNFFSQRVDPILIELTTGAASYHFSYVKKLPLKNIINSLEKQQSITFNLIDRAFSKMQNAVTLKRLNTKETAAVQNWLATV